VRGAGGGGWWEGSDRKPIAPGYFGQKIYRLRPVPPTVELTDLMAIRSVERRRQIHLTLSNDRVEKLPRSERDEVRMSLPAGQITFDQLARFERFDLWLVLRDRKSTRLNSSH